MISYAYLALYLIICILFSAVIALMPQILEFIGLEKKHYSIGKYDTYECGLRTIGRSWIKYNPHYYYYALMLTAMDTSLIFLIIWAKVLNYVYLTSHYMFWIGIVFIFIIGCGFFYAWKKGVLKWN